MCIHTTVPVLAVSRRRWICNLTENNSRQSKVIKHTHTHTLTSTLVTAGPQGWWLIHSNWCSLLLFRCRGSEWRFARRWLGSSRGALGGSLGGFLGSSLTISWRRSSLQRSLPCGLGNSLGGSTCPTGFRGVVTVRATIVAGFTINVTHRAYKTHIYII